MGSRFQNQLANGLNQYDPRDFEWGLETQTINAQVVRSLKFKNSKICFLF